MTQTKTWSFFAIAALWVPLATCSAQSSIPSTTPDASSQAMKILAEPQSGSDALGLIGNPKQLRPVQPVASLIQPPRQLLPKAPEPSRMLVPAANTPNGRDFANPTQCPPATDLPNPSANNANFDGHVAPAQFSSGTVEPVEHQEPVEQSSACDDTPVPDILAGIGAPPSLLPSFKSASPPANASSPSDALKSSPVATTDLDVPPPLTADSTPENSSMATTSANPVGSGIAVPDILARTSSLTSAAVSPRRSIPASTAVNSSPTENPTASAPIAPGHGPENGPENPIVLMPFLPSPLELPPQNSGETPEQFVLREVAPQMNPDAGMGPIRLQPVSRITNFTIEDNGGELTVAQMTGPMYNTGAMLSGLSLENPYRTAAYGSPAPTTRSTLSPDGYSSYYWSQSTYTWITPTFRHRPLYFEQINLERYGIQRKLPWEPVVSAADFFGTAFWMPLTILQTSPCTDVYTLGHQRPGDCAVFQTTPRTRFFRTNCN